MQQSDWAFPAVESLHVIALSIVLGTIGFVDLRLIGVLGYRLPITGVAKDCLRWTWGAFLLAATSGALMFITQAASYYGNFAFRMKMLLMVAAGINMLVFELGTVRGVAAWDRDAAAPMSAKLAGALSLLFWLAIVAFGRWIGFTKVPY